MDAPRLVSAEVLGYNTKTVFVNSTAYVVFPPTIRKLCGAVYWLSDIKEADTLAGVIGSLKDLGAACKALSFLIQGDEGLWDTLSEGTLEEVVTALSEAFELVDIANFLKLSVLTRSARTLTAKQR